jgi:hypothetical protein
MLNKIVRETFSGKVRILPLIEKEEGELLVWWYSGIVKNYRAQSEPKVVVFFRELNNDVPGAFKSISVPLTNLGLLRIGTIWEKGQCKAEAVMETKQFHVDFNNGSWKIVSPMDAKSNGYAKPFTQSDYPLKYESDRNWLLKFPFSDGRGLLTPCLEFFSRCYGCSEEVKRVLATYTWGEAESRLYIPVNKTKYSGKWPIKLKSRIYNGDTTFLAHVYYEKYAEEAAKKIHSQIEASFLNKEQIAFIEVIPWFQGPAQIRVKGFWIDNGKSFLGLQIIGYSEPDGVPIYRDRENTNITGPLEEDAKLGKSWHGATIRKKNKKTPMIVDLTADDEPDHGAASVEVANPEIIILGERRAIIDVRRETAKSTSGKLGNGKTPKAFSGGEAYGSGKDVGHASIHASIVMESKGALRDMWEAMLALKNERPDFIKSVEWFTFMSGFSSDIEPKTNALQPFDRDAKVNTKTRNWLYSNVHKKDPRGILVARIKSVGKIIYIIEIERRPRTKIDKNGKVVDAEEPFQGLVMALENHEQFILWLPEFMSEVRQKLGIVQKLVGKCPGVAKTFRHPASPTSETPGRAALMNALKKMDIIFESKATPLRQSKTDF